MVSIYFIDVSKVKEKNEAEANTENIMADNYPEIVKDTTPLI